MFNKKSKNLSKFSSFLSSLREKYSKLTCVELSVEYFCIELFFSLEFPG